MALRRDGGLVGKALARLEESAGVVVVPKAEFELKEAIYDDYRVLNRQLEDIGWSVLDYIGGQPTELSQQSRRRIVQRARYVWMNDPQAGAAVELMNDFCFGRGVPRPRAKDKAVQDWIDKAWDDPDNQEVLTTIEAQQALGTDLALQSNVFLLMFDDGDDGMVKLSILRHDDVTEAIPDPDKRHRILWYVCAQPRRQLWDFTQNMWQQPKLMTMQMATPIYYPHWRNVELAREEVGRETPLDEPAPTQIGAGKVYHIRINRYTEQRFGSPRFQRTMRWYSAYNQFVKDRLDVVSAAAAIIMKRKLKASPSQLARDASKALSRRSPLAASGLAGGPDQPAPLQMPPRAGGIVVENESADLEPFNIDTGAGNAAEDAQIIRSPISAAERFPQSYFGDASNANLATATSLELPVLKAVETRQEAFEGIFRWFIDRVIERGVETGNIDELLGPDEVPVDDGEFDPDDPFRDTTGALQQSLEEAAQKEFEAGRAIVEIARVRVPEHSEVVPMMVSRSYDGRYHYTLIEYEDQQDDEEDTERDLSYEFKMPSPLRRMMTDLISAITQVAQTFDPNNTNPNLSRALLTLALGEGFEVQDAPDLVDQIIPKGYVDPMVKAQLAAAQAGAIQPGMAADGQPMEEPNPNEENPYSAPMQSTQPEDMRSGPYNAVEAAFDDNGAYMGMWALNRKGERVFYSHRPRHLVEATHHGVILPTTATRPTAPVVDEATETAARGDIGDAQQLFREEVIDTGLDALDDSRLGE